MSFRVGRTSADLRHSLPPAPPRSHSLAQVTAISFILYPTSVPPATPIPTSRPLHTPNVDPKVTLGQVSVPEGSWDTSRPLSLLLQRLLSIPRGGSGADECPARVSVGAPAEQSRSLSGRSSTALSEHRHYHSSAAFELDHSSPPTGGPNRQDRTEVFTKSRLPGGGSSGRGGAGGGKEAEEADSPPARSPPPHLYQAGSWVNERSRATECLSRRYTHVVLLILQTATNYAFRRRTFFDKEEK